MLSLSQTTAIAYRHFPLNALPMTTRSEMN